MTAPAREPAEGGPGVAVYQLRLFDGPWQTVTLQQWIAAERDAGFTSRGGSGPATGGFGYGSTVHGRVLHGAAAAAARGPSPEVEALRVENDRLRALLANSNAPCPYCGLAAADMAKCAHGFPGCSRADDLGTDDLPPMPEPDPERAALDDAIPDLDTPSPRGAAPDARAGSEALGGAIDDTKKAIAGVRRAITGDEHGR